MKNFVLILGVCFGLLTGPTICGWTENTEDKTTRKSELQAEIERVRNDYKVLKEDLDLEFKAKLSDVEKNGNNIQDRAAVIKNNRSKDALLRKKFREAMQNYQNQLAQLKGKKIKKKKQIQIYVAPPSRICPLRSVHPSMQRRYSCGGCPRQQ